MSASNLFRRMPTVLNQASALYRAVVLPVMVHGLPAHLLPTLLALRPANTQAAVRPFTTIASSPLAVADTSLSVRLKPAAVPDLTKRLMSTGEEKGVNPEYIAKAKARLDKKSKIDALEEKLLKYLDWGSSIKDLEEVLIKMKEEGIDLNNTRLEIEQVRSVTFEYYNKILQAGHGERTTSLSLSPLELAVYRKDLQTTEALLNHGVKLPNDLDEFVTNLARKTCTYVRNNHKGDVYHDTYLGGKSETTIKHNLNLKKNPAIDFLKELALVNEQEAQAQQPKAPANNEQSGWKDRVAKEKESDNSIATTTLKR